MRFTCLRFVCMSLLFVMCPFLIGSNCDSGDRFVVPEDVELGEFFDLAGLCYATLKEDVSPKSLSVTQSLSAG